MNRCIRSLAISLAALLLPMAGFGSTVWASGGNNAIQTVGLHRQDCTATNVGPIVGNARFSLDDQGGGSVNPNGIEIRTEVDSGTPRSSYSVYVLASPCQVLELAGTLNTDDSGRGDLDVHVQGSVLPAGASLRVQLVDPTNGDLITSDPTGAM